MRAGKHPDILPAPESDMKIANALIAILLFASIAGFTTRHASAHEAAKPDASNTPHTFACDDTIARADGSLRTGLRCEVAREFCYEASGGPAIGHGAECRPLPSNDTTCTDLIAQIGAGTTCSGDAGSGLRVGFVFP